MAPLLSPQTMLQFQFPATLIFSLLMLVIPLCHLYLTRLHQSEGSTVQHKKNQLVQLPPGPKPWPIVGSLPEMLISTPSFRWIHNVMKEMKSDIIYIRVGKFDVITVTCPKISRELFRKQDAVFQSRPSCMAAALLSSGYSTTVFVPFGDQWKKMRKVITNELLTPQKFQLHHDKRIEEADNLVRYVYSHTGNELVDAVNLRTAARHYSGNLIRRTIFNRRHFGVGTKNGGPGIEEDEHVEAIFAILKYLYAFSVSDYMPCLRRFDLDGHQKSAKEAVETLDKYHDPIIYERMRMWGQSARKEVEDWLDMLITLKDKKGKPFLTHEEIVAEIKELMVAAVDNPSNALEWAMAEMLNNQELFQKATEELDRVIGKDRLVQESDFPKLFYVKALAREAFRMHPIAPFNPPHVALSDTTVANYFIPKGSHVYLSRMGLGRNPNAWDDPDTFKPERHLKEDGSDILLSDPDFRILSFSSGRRGCPGVTLGSAMTIMLFARLLHSFEWSLPPGQSSVDLRIDGDSNDIFLAKPLVAIAKPRLVAEAYMRCLAMN